MEFYSTNGGNKPILSSAVKFFKNKTRDINNAVTILNSRFINKYLITLNSKKKYLCINK